MRPFFVLLMLLLIAFPSFADDTLRGGNNAFRKFWDVIHYKLYISIDLQTKRLWGNNVMRFRGLQDLQTEMQIDLQEPLEARSFAIRERGAKEALTVSEIRREGSHYFLKMPLQLKAGKEYELNSTYSGRPREAKDAPWDGGFVWSKSATGKPWVAVACQGDGASLWFPCKDLQSDEPDSGATLLIRNSANLPVISNGQLIEGTLEENPVWDVRSSINPYNITFYIGDYVGWKEQFPGAEGTLPLSFYVLRENEKKARKQFAVVPKMLRCFEEKIGPYPFYNDGYKLVEAPYLGMEHQSAVAYGNHYKMGYLGEDRSGTGVGKTFDYIIVHESGHEWFGNSMTAQDVADNWIHEGFTTYLESVFVECHSGKEAALKYLHGERQNILNDRPIIGQYGVFDEGSGDKYDKGAAIIGMLRAMEPNDESFWKHFREMYRQFARSIVTSAKVEAYWSKALGRDLKPFFDQYLRTTDIPAVRYWTKGIKSWIGLKDAVEGLTLPLIFDTQGKPIEVGNTLMPLSKGSKKPRIRKEFYVKDF